MKTLKSPSINIVKSHKSRGFTLPEILVALAILGIVAALVAPKIMDAMNAQAEEKIVSDMTSIINGAIIMKGSSSSYSGVTCNGIASGGYGQVTFSSCTGANPRGGNYTFAASGNTITVTSTGIPSRMCTRIARTLNSGNASGTCSGTTVSISQTGT